MRRGRRESARRRVRALHLLYNHIKYFKREREREIKTDTRRESEREREHAFLAAAKASKAGAVL